MSGPADELAAYALLASAVSGRRLCIGFHDARDPRAYTDGRTVLVSAARRDELWVDVLLQALLVRVGSLEPALLAKLVARPARARAYLAYELARGLRRHHMLVPSRLFAHESLAPLPEPTQSAHASYARAKREERGETPVAWGVLRPGLVLRTSGRAFEASAAELGEVSVVEASRARADDDELERSSILDAFRAPVETSTNVLSQLLRGIFDMQGSRAERRRGGGEGGEPELTNDVREGASLSLVQQPDARAMAQLEPVLAGEHSYPEWDAARGRYLREHVRVAEVDPEPEHTSGVVFASESARSRALRRTLSRLYLGYEPHRRQPLGDDLDVDALVRVASELRAGFAADLRLYRANLRTRRDLGVLVLVDITASTAERGPDGLSVFERQTSFALALVRSMYEAGDRVACYGFHSMGPKIVRMQRVLAFGERADARVLRRASHMAPAGYSRLGAAIRHGTWALGARSGMPHRLLVLISDGFAYDRGYEGEHAWADTRRALEEARARMTACVSLSIGSSADCEQLERVFGASHQLAVPSLWGHERELGALFERSVAEVAMRRRA